MDEEGYETRTYKACEALIRKYAHKYMKHDPSFYKDLESKPKGRTHKEVEEICQEAMEYMKQNPYVTVSAVCNMFQISTTALNARLKKKKNKKGKKK